MIRYEKAFKKDQDYAIKKILIIYFLVFFNTNLDIKVK